MNQDDLMCICGHLKVHHLDDGIFTDCLVTYSDKAEDCGCMKFKLNNLSYLEQKYNESRKDISRS